MIRYALSLVAVPLLIGCGDDADPAAGAGDDARSVSGDVLEGSISDEMLPLDRLQSASPSADPSEANEDDETDSNDAE